MGRVRVSGRPTRMRETLRLGPEKEGMRASEGSMMMADRRGKEREKENQM